MHRLIVCFDVPGETIEDSYTALEKELRHIPFGWETSDEAYYEDGEEINPVELQKAIVSSLIRKSCKPFIGEKHEGSES